MKNLTPENADIKALVCFLSAHSGGRASPPTSGYRGQVFFDDSDRDAIHIFGQEPVPFGQEIRDHIFIVNRENLQLLRVGMVFLIREGMRTVGYGQITELNNPSIRTSLETQTN